MNFGAAWPASLRPPPDAAALRASSSVFLHRVTGACSRALVELFSRPAIANALAFRGGTALYKLHLRPAARYSEDIDLVQTQEGGIGPVLDAIHEAGWVSRSGSTPRAGAR